MKSVLNFLVFVIIGVVVQVGFKYTFGATFDSGYWAGVIVMFLSILMNGGKL